MYLSSLLPFANAFARPLRIVKLISTQNGAPPVKVALHCSIVRKPQFGGSDYRYRRVPEAPLALSSERHHDPGREAHCKPPVVIEDKHL